ncbi:hypothetical protein DV495_001334 [Geotrichum candidum]|nr:hypothetical protein DV454_000618 [Geotrichum candidum]KAF5132428.1 hypothetical protein DV495_001334 [Geotrichum candidum]
MAPKPGSATTPKKATATSSKSSSNKAKVPSSKPAKDLTEQSAVAVNEKEKKKQNFIIRTIWTLVMIGGFFLIIAAGHIYIIGLVVLIQILAFKEVITLAAKPSIEKKLPWGRTLNWYFLATTIYFLEGESVIYYFKHIVLVDSFLLPLAINHRFFSYCLYIIGFVFFVFSLEKNHYKFQFTQFCITHMALLLVVIQGNFIVSNIFSGIFWFFVPAALVITNDIFAYLCGITFGRTPLIKISPKKTVEGFVGAWICTIFMAIILCHFLIRFDYFICPMKDLGTNAWSNTTCTPNPVFLSSAHRVPTFLQPLLHTDRVSFPAIHFHVAVLATFASLIAPFGGFFASGLKRSFQVKDFGNTIPGHGGIVDRFDCQFVMGFFSYLYYDTFVATHGATMGSVLQSAILNLDHKDQIQLTVSLTKYLANNGIIDEKVVKCITSVVGEDYY